MPIRDIDTRSVTLVDIPLVRRLADRGVLLASEVEFTRETSGPSGALISSIILPQRSLYTLVCRADKQQVVGQFRLKPDDPNAHLIYVAPDLPVHGDDTAWLHVLDAMAREAGRHGAHAMVAEVEEQSLLFETFRTAGYAVYARQEIWEREPGAMTFYDADYRLDEATDEDEHSIQLLLHNTVPTLLHAFARPLNDTRGLVYRRGGRIEAFFAYSEGHRGIYVMPYLSPDLISEAPDLLEAALRRIPRADRNPIYMCVRRYQDWLIEALAEIRFHPRAQQAVMVKHITAGVRHAHFARPEPVLERAVQPIKPPSMPVVQCHCRDNNQA